MPNVGGKKFPYTPKGKAAASRARKPRANAVKRARPMAAQRPAAPMARPMAQRPMGRPMARRRG
tara:strand:+ start:85 stop:276 length:192 start_codon:yes stop_codon:yes gene_type:complete